MSLDYVNAIQESALEYSLLGNTGLFISRMGLGGMTFGGRGTPIYGEVGGLDLKQTKEIVNIAVREGINFIDTADVYSNGESEILLGKAISPYRNDIILATKFHAPMDRAPNRCGQSRYHMIRSLEDSLNRLNTDRIDLYQIHNFDPLTPFDEVLRALDDVVKQGKVRYIGCSNLAAWQIMKALGISEHKNLNKFTSVQAYYSLLGRDVEHELLPLINDQKLGLLVWGPLAAGFLSGKYTDSDTINKSRRDKFDFPPIDKKKAFNIIDVLSSIAKKYKVSVAQVSLSWLLSKPTVSSIITGVRNADQLMDNLSAINLSLSINDIEELDNVSTTYIPYPNWIQSNAIEIRTPT